MIKSKKDLKEENKMKDEDKYQEMGLPKFKGSVHIQTHRYSKAIESWEELEVIYNGHPDILSIHAAKKKNFKNFIEELWLAKDKIKRRATFRFYSLESEKNLLQFMVERNNKKQQYQRDEPDNIIFSN